MSDLSVRVASKAEPDEDGETPDARFTEFSESKKEAEAGFIKSNVGVIRRAATESSVTKREKADGSKDLSHCTHSLDKVRRRSCFLLFNV